MAKVFSIRRAVLALGTAAVLALSTGVVPSPMSSAPSAQAAELARGGHHGGGHHGGHHGGHRGGHHRDHHGGHHGGGHHGGFHGGHHGGFHGSGHHSFWGHGYHIYYPHLYRYYDYEPTFCTQYYPFEGGWYCFTGYYRDSRNH